MVLFLAIVGLANLSKYWAVFEALNPLYGVRFLFSSHNAAGLAIMGTVFLSTTGAEALYSDMGHVGRGNIYFTWPFIKIALVLNYFGQGAWMLPIIAIIRNNCDGVTEPVLRNDDAQRALSWPWCFPFRRRYRLPGTDYRRVHDGV